MEKINEQQIKKYIDDYYNAIESNNILGRDIAFTLLLPHLSKQELKELLQNSFNTEELQ